MVRRPGSQIPLADRPFRKLYARRRETVESKVRHMIVDVARLHRIDMHVTVIYEYKNEVSMFRSQQEDGRHMSTTLGELRTVSTNNTDMNHETNADKKLKQWKTERGYQSSVAFIGPSTPQRETRNRGQTQVPNQTNDMDDDLSEDNTDDDDDTDDSNYDDSEDDQEQEDSLGIRPEFSCEEVPRQSPKRKRGATTETGQVGMPSFPSSHNTPVFQVPVYNSYLGPGQQMQLAGPANGFSNFESIPTQPNGFTPVNAFLNNMPSFDVGAGFSPERNPAVMPAQTVSGGTLPQPPIPKKGRGPKGTRKGRGGGKRSKAD